MRVLLDEQPCASEASTIGDAIDRAAAAAETRGRVVVEVVVDGVRWGEAELSSHERRTKPADEVACVTADLRELIVQTLTDASAGLRDADAIQRESAELMQADRQPEAMARLGEALDIWQRVQEAVCKSSDAIGLDLTSLPLPGDSFDVRIARLNEHLRTLQAGLENGDPVGLADTLLYDLPTVVADWRELLDTMAAHVRDVTGPATESRNTNTELS